MAKIIPAAGPAGNRGFSLVELTVVMAIMAVLVSSAMPLYELTAQREKEKELRVGLRQIREALDAYKRAVNEGRVARKADESDYPRKLEDPMSIDPALADAETWGKRSYESPPDNPQEGNDVFDVYSRSQQIGLNGIAYDRW